jgi:uncharacterized protein YggE
MRIFSLFLILFSTTCLAEATSSPHRTITVTGQGNVSSVPNLFSFSIHLEQKGKQAKELNQAMTQTTHKVISQLKSLGVDKSSIQALQVRFSPWIEYKREGNQQKGFILARKINVTLDDLKQYDQAIDALLNIGITRIDGFNYTNDQTDKHYELALAKALKNAKHRAAFMAQSLGVSIEQVVSITEQSNGHISRPVMFSEARMAKADSYEPGQMSTQAKVLVVFSLKDK